MHARQFADGIHHHAAQSPAEGTIFVMLSQQSMMLFEDSDKHILSQLEVLAATYDVKRTYEGLQTKANT